MGMQHFRAHRASRNQKFTDQRTQNHGRATTRSRTGKALPQVVITGVNRFLTPISVVKPSPMLHIFGMRSIELHREMLAERHLNDECLLIPIDASGVEMFELNAWGTDLWERVLAGDHEADLCRWILENCKVDEATVQADVAEFLEQLAAIKALTLHESGKVDG